MRMAMAAIALLLMIGSALAEDRSLTLRHTHTGKSATILFKHDGKYDPEGLRQLNALLADWRNGKQIEMDPALFDLLWTVYQDVGATQPINIVSSYRSPETNAMLRAKSSGVAENSQHMRGKAMDFFIPGVRLADLRAAAMKRQGGGVGYYPTSGSPFVHLDTGSVRAWPRMTTAQLKNLFPDGRTVHLPSDGPPLAGHDIAVAAMTAPTAVVVAATAPPKKGRTLMDMIFGSGETQAPAASVPTVAVAAVEEDRLAPSLAGLPLVEIEAPTPRIRPAGLAAGPDVQVAMLAPVPQVRRTGRFTINVLEASYPVMGYAPPSGATETTDPFAFVENLTALRQPSPAKPVAEDRPSGLPDRLQAPVAFSSSEFAVLTAPDVEDVSFLLRPSDGSEASTLEPHRTRRF